MDHAGETVRCDLNRKGFNLTGPYRRESIADCREGETADPIEEASHSKHFFLLLLLLRGHRLGDSAGGIDGGLGGVDGAHDVGPGGGIQSEGSRDSGNLTRGEHEAQAQ